MPELLCLLCETIYHIEVINDVIHVPKSMHNNEKNFEFIRYKIISSQELFHSVSKIVIQILMLVLIHKD